MGPTGVMKLVANRINERLGIQPQSVTEWTALRLFAVKSYELPECLHPNGHLNLHVTNYN
jgi:hypothetical protein